MVHMIIENYVMIVWSYIQTIICFSKEHHVTNYYMSLNELERPNLFSNEYINGIIKNAYMLCTAWRFSGYFHFKVNTLDPIRLTLLCLISFMYFCYMVFINGKGQMVWIYDTQCT